MTGKFRIVLLVLATGICVAVACTSKNEPSDSTPILTGDYLGQKLPGATPEIFAEGVVSTGMGERDGCFSPDGKEFYYSVSSPYFSAILFMKRENDRWTGPQVASFSGRYWDIEPAFSPDGNKLYFASNRPRTAGAAPRDFDIWYVERAASGWSEPRHIDGSCNSDMNEFYPSLTRDGVLYFTTTRPGGHGGEDIYCCRPVNGQFGQPENLGPGVNSSRYDYNAFVAPDESYIIFTSYGREDERGGGDLYISYRRPDSGWTPAQNMGDSVNSPTIDYCPSVTPDGRFLIFTSKRGALRGPLDTAISYDSLVACMTGVRNGQDNIYWRDAAIIEQLRPR